MKFSNWLPLIAETRDRSLAVGGEWTAALPGGEPVTISRQPDRQGKLLYRVRVGTEIFACKLFPSYPAPAPYHQQMATWPLARGAAPRPAGTYRPSRPVAKGTRLAARRHLTSLAAGRSPLASSRLSCTILVLKYCCRTYAGWVACPGRARPTALELAVQ
jgi:hypothetical protein